MSARGYLFDCMKNAVYLNNNRYANKQNDCVVIRSKQNLMERYGLMGLVSVAESLGITVLDDWTSEDLTNAVWYKFKELTDEQIRDERRTKRASYREVSGEGRKPGNHSAKPRRRRWPRVYHISFEKISEELRPLGDSRLPQQARTIIDCLRQQPSRVLTEQEMMDFVQKLADEGKLVGRRRSDGTNDPIQQSAWRIFSYYEAAYDNLGLIKRELVME